jgi:hypothetical protein
MRRAGRKPLSRYAHSPVLGCKYTTSNSARGPYPALVARNRMLFVGAICGVPSLNADFNRKDFRLTEPFIQRCLIYFPSVSWGKY